VREIGFEWLKRQFIAAIALDESLFDALVLKGGNALSLLHSIGMRTSIDLDYSMSGEPTDPDNFGERILAALDRRLSGQGLVVFDAKFEARPRSRRPGIDRWGGYSATFKLIRTEDSERLQGDVSRMRRESIPVLPSPQGERTFRIEISSHEYCEERTQIAVEGETMCWVYTLDLMAAEKLRALCQQMDEYGRRVHPAPRARDFYDLHAILTEGGVELSAGGMHDLVRVVFDKKDVPVRLVGLLDSYREFHRSDWPSVQSSIPAGRHSDYDFYVDFAVSEIRKLEPLWIEDSP